MQLRITKDTSNFCYLNSFNFRAETKIKGVKVYYISIYNLSSQIHHGIEQLCMVTGFKL